MANSPFPDDKTVAVATLWRGGTDNDVRMGEMLEKYGYRGTFYGDGALPEEEVSQLLEWGHDFLEHEPALPQSADLKWHHHSDPFGDIMATWSEIEEKTGSILMLYGNPSELPPDPKEWIDFECIMGYLGGISHVWYCSASELAAFLAKE